MDLGAQGKKKICLIRDERSFWKTISEYITGINAELSTFEGKPDYRELRSCRPDLIVTGARVHHDMIYRMNRIPVIVVKDGVPPVMLKKKKGERNLLITGWPLDKEQFLEITSQMLSITPRRAFTTIIRIFSESGGTGHHGLSINFSMSGLAFFTDKELRNGERIAVSFSVPEGSGTLRLSVEVVRNWESGEENKKVYGARYTGLTDKDRRLLEEFILNV